MAQAPVRERRQVSVLFCDLVEFTNFSESRDPEDVRDVLGHYFAAARRIVGAYGGTIEKFIGDAVMALWGAPVAREDDAERSVRAGIGIVESVAVLAERLSIPELRVRVGVLTGEAAVEIGSVHEGMVTGDAVNTAARIQSIAAAGSVLVDDTTRLACEQAIVFEPGGTHALKGKSSPIRVWRAVCVRDDSRGAFRSGAVEPPLVGRDDQLETVSAALAALRGPGTGIRIVTVVGEAGIGKSRLGWELEGRVEGADRIRWHRGRSLGFGEGSGLSALAEIVRTGLGIARNDPVVQQRALVEQFVEQRFVEDSGERLRVARAVQRLLDLDDGEELIEQGALFSAWRALFVRLAAEGPVVLVLEEVQLADQALFDFVAYLRERSDAAPILILALSRPDPRLDPLTRPTDQIELLPLSNAEMDELVAGAVEAAPAVLLSAIRADGGGVPLYAVETLRALADRGVLEVQGTRYVVRGSVGEASVPPTITALVSSRLDRLGRLERRILTAGAVLGESFSSPAAAVVSGIDEGDARALLDGLVAKALLRFESDMHLASHGRYGFLQGVVRRVALARLSRRERKRAHLAAVDYLTAQSESEPELAAVLAGHLLAAEEADPNAEDVDLIRARAQLTVAAAAERAAAVGALTEAVALFDRAVTLTADEAERAALFERAGAVAFRAGDADSSSQRYRSAQQLHAAAGRERERLRVRAHELRARYHVGTAAELLPALRELDAELGDERDAVKALAGNALAFTLYQCGEHDEALAVASRSASIAEECGDDGEFVGALGAQASALQELERPQEAIALLRRAVPLADRYGPRRVAPVLGNLAVLLTSVGSYSEAAERAREAIAAAQRGSEILFERWARLVLARILCSAGEWDQAVAEIELVREHVPPFYVGMAVAPLVVIGLARGQRDYVRALVDEHDRRVGGDPEMESDSDFRVLRSAALIVDRGGSAAELARLIEAAGPTDYAEWTGWLERIVDVIVGAPAAEPIATALGALRRPGAIKLTPAVLAQAQRLEAHFADRANDHGRCARCFNEAVRLATDSGLAFERAVVVLEQAEHAARNAINVDDVLLVDALATFKRLSAAPWLTRAAPLCRVEPA
ncbi:MAG: adenylate/guanylate cyclase domain-containing protein [Solirubrobacteraceae bacterium]